MHLCGIQARVFPADGRRDQLCERRHVQSLSDFGRKQLFKLLPHGHF